VEKSIQRFESLLRLDKGRSAYGREILARYYQKTDQYRLAIKQYEIAAQIERHCRYLHEKATLHCMLGQYSQALEAVTQALGTDSSYVETYNTKTVILQAMRCYEEAEEALKRGLELDQNAYHLHGNLGRLYAKMQRHPEAIKHLEIDPKLTPHDQKYFQVRQDVGRLRRFLREKRN
jgi:tetratricopeptide (TPR) repeat protein